VSTHEIDPAMAPELRLQPSRAAQRAREALPAIRITLVSIIVALVFENLLEVLSANPYLWTVTIEGLLTWLRTLATTATVILIWLGMALMITVIDRAPFPRDFLLPVVLLALLHVLIGTIESESAHAWLYAAAGGQVIGASMIWLDARGDARIQARPANRRAWALSVRFQVTLAALTWLGAMLVHAGVLDARAGVVLTAAYLLGQSIHVAYLMRAWRALVERAL
jgi:hypothetical protein